MNLEAIGNGDVYLLISIKEGNREAFDILFHKYYKPLCAYAHRWVELSDAEEIVQNLFLWIWENRETFVIRTVLSAYLFRAVYLRCLSCIEQRELKRRVETLYWQNNKDTSSYIKDVSMDELLKRLHEAIARLPESYRQAFILHRFKDKSYKEIAAEFNVSPKTIDYRIQQALKLLRDDLKEFFPILL